MLLILLSCVEPVIVMDDLLREFLAETGEHLDAVDLELVRLERDPGDAAILRSIFRLVHTIKGTCGFLGLPRIEGLAHAAESLMGQLRGGQAPTVETVSLILAAIDRIKLILAELEQIGAEPAGSDADLIGALERASGMSAAGAGGEPSQVLLRPLRPGEVSLEELERAFQATPGPDVLPPSRPVARPAIAPVAAEAPSRVPTIRVSVDTLERLTAGVSELVLTRNQLLDIAARESGVRGAFAAPLQRLSQVTTELQDGIMKTRMQPIGTAWSKLPRLVRDLAAELGKEIDLLLSGAGTEVDRQILDTIRDPLTHIVRNSAAHGIEMPTERRLRGKAERGTIRLHAYEEDGGITVEISDDGAGLDLDAIRRRAVELGIGSGPAVARMTDREVAELIFRPGFSTAAVADAVSGRGFGMDVVRTNLDEVGGAIELASEPGQGTTLKLRLPLTLAILPVLLVEAAGQLFALPQVSILELVRAGPGTENRLERVQDSLLLRLRGGLLSVIDLAEMLGGSRGSPAGFVVVVQVGRVRFGLAVDALLSTEEVVAKPISVRLKPIGLFSATTLLGDGSVVLMVDPKGIARRAGIEPDAEMSDEARAAVADDGVEATSLLVCRGGDGTLSAVPLGLVSRLEEIDAARVEQAGGGPAIQYRGSLMPLLPIGPGTRLRRQGKQPIVVVTPEASPVGLVVDGVVDIVEEPLAVTPSVSRPDLLGTAIVAGRATEIVDLMAILPLGRRAVAGRPTVLLVEDNPFFRDLLTSALSAAGYRVRSAANADEGLALLLDQPIEAVVTDLDLPGRPGLDLVRAMRLHPETATVPVVVSGASPVGEELTALRSLGVQHVVPKFDRAGLVAALNRARRGPEALAA